MRKMRQFVPSSIKNPIGFILTTAPLPPANGKESVSFTTFTSPYSPPPLKFPSVIFEKGIYDAHVSDLTPIDIHISNTNSELENNSILRNCFVLLKNVSEITINGGGSFIRCHGKMTTIAITHSKNITFKNCDLRYLNATKGSTTTRLDATGVFIGYSVSGTVRYCDFINNTANKNGQGMFGGTALLCAFENNDYKETNIEESKDFDKSK